MTMRKNKRPACPGCGRPMVVRYEKTKIPIAGGGTIEGKGQAQVGYNGEGHFCSLTCGYRFAVAALPIVARECRRRGAGKPATSRDVLDLGKFLDVTA